MGAEKGLFDIQVQMYIFSNSWQWLALSCWPLAFSPLTANSHLWEEGGVA